MHVKYLQCVKCGRTYAKNRVVFRCDCGESLDVVYDYHEIKNRISWKRLRRRSFNHWRYREFFPVAMDKNIVTMMEGGTALIKSKNVSKILGMKNLYFKLEGTNPTGSFKDRGTTVEISKAAEFGVDAVACASTGNMAASVAAYAAAAGISATIYLPENTPRSKISQIASYGAAIKKVAGDYTAAVKAAQHDFEKNKTYLMGDYPYRGEGEKSVGYELADQLRQLDYIVVPVGNGTLMHGIWKSMKEMRAVGLIKTLPRLFAVQASGCSTVARAFLEKRNEIKPVVPRTKASAIACGSPLDGLEALQALRDSGGSACVVSDADMLAAKKMLARREGIYAELSAAAPLAGLIKMARKMPKSSKIALIITGHGLKDP